MDVDENDKPFLTGERTSEGFYKTRKGFDQALSRGLAYAEYADMVWCETGTPDLAFAKKFAEGIRRKYPGKMLAYNCSPSFNWKRNLDDATIAKFQRELGAMGYKFQFITLAGFHSLNYSMFELAYGYARNDMSAFVELQEKEFAAAEKGFTAVKHQREVGTGYFDQITQVVTAGKASTTALHGSTEDEQFFGEKGEAGRGVGPAAEETSEILASGPRRRAVDHDALLAGLQAGIDAHAAPRHAVVRRQELDQRRVRLAVDRGRREPHLDALAVLAGELGARGARLDVQLQDHAQPRRSGR